jgi:ribosome assembly protein YihI (activator of Der GTPase)
VSNTPTPTGVASDRDENYAKLERIALDQAMELEKLEDRARAAELLRNLAGGKKQCPGI